MGKSQVISEFILLGSNANGIQAKTESLKKKHKFLSTTSNNPSGNKTEENGNNETSWISSV